MTDETTVPGNQPSSIDPAPGDRGLIAQKHRALWLEERRTGIGGSDAAAVLGLSRWASPYSLWAEKRGLRAPTESTERMEAGTRLEPVIRQWYEDATGREVVYSPGIVRSKVWPWMIGTMDGFVRSDGATWILECKLVDFWEEKKWRDGAPLYYQIQGQHYMAVMEADRCDFAVLFGGNKFRHYEFRRNDDFIAQLVEQEEAFWGLVTSGTPPKVDDHAATEAALGEVHRAGDGSAIEMSDDLCHQYESAKDHLNTAKKALRGVQNQIRAAMGKASTAHVAGLGRWRLSGPPGQARRLSFKKAKP